MTDTTAQPSAPAITLSGTAASFATALLSFFALAVPGYIAFSNAFAADHTTAEKIVTAATFILLLLGGALTFGVPLIPSLKWQGIAKTGIAIFFAIVSAVLPFVTNTFDLGRDLPLIVVALVNVLATELGVQIRTRTQAIIDARETNVVTSVPSPAPVIES